MVASAAGANRILSLLSFDEFARIAPDLHPVDLPQGHVLYEWQTSTTDVLFPSTSVISMVMQMEDGQSVESVLVGADGVAGSWVACGVHRAPWRVVVQTGGRALAMDSSTFCAHLEANATLRQLTLRYGIAAHYLTSQSVGCTRFHDLGARAARWLLMVSERTASTEIRLTQEFLSQMLGAHRPSITVVLGALEQDGLISRRRPGVIDIVDLERLEAAACECYRKVRDYSERVFDLSDAL